MLNIAYRNIKVFFRDKAAVFFSFLAVFIIFGLYLFFLGDTLTGGAMKDMEGVRFLMDSWIMAGILAVTSITTTMGAFGAMVEDKYKKNFKDFQAAPLKRYQIAGGYVISSYVIGVIMSVLTLILAEVYIVINGGEIMPAMSILKTLGLILLSVLASSSLVFFIVSFFESNNAFATASTILGTLIGFLTGVYIPIGDLPDYVQAVIKVFPVSHAGVLFRKVLMEQPMEITFAGVPQEYVTDFQSEMGVILQYGDYTADVWVHIAVLIATVIVFYGLAIFNVSRKKAK
jgi:multidrug/hemolysin transport system permease protein